MQDPWAANRRCIRGKCCVAAGKGGQGHLNLLCCVTLLHWPRIAKHALEIEADKNSHTAMAKHIAASAKVHGLKVQDSSLLHIHRHKITHAWPKKMDGYHGRMVWTHARAEMNSSVHTWFCADKNILGPAHLEYPSSMHAEMDACQGRCFMALDDIWASEETWLHQECAREKLSANGEIWLNIWDIFSRIKINLKTKFPMILDVLFGHGMVVETCPNGKPILLHPCLFKMIVWKWWMVQGVRPPSTFQ